MKLDVNIIITEYKMAWHKNSDHEVAIILPPIQNKKNKKKKTSHLGNPQNT